MALQVLDQPKADAEATIFYLIVHILFFRKSSDKRTSVQFSLSVFSRTFHALPLHGIFDYSSCQIAHKILSLYIYLRCQQGLCPYSS